MKNRQEEEYEMLDKSELIKRLLQAKDSLIQKEHEVERLKSSFLSNVSHEIRTPMNAIIGFSDILKEGNFSKDEQQYFFDGISSSAYQLLAIIDNIIEAARIQSNEIVPTNEVCPINDFLENIYLSYLDNKQYIGKKHISLKLNQKNSGNPYMVTDTSILRKILSNLIDNALKFTENGSVEIGYNIFNDKQVQFYVFDTGIGIPEDKYDIIFEKFRQLDDKFSKKHGGLGMGLCISKKLVQLLGGKIDIMSSKKSGTKVYISFPLKTVSSQHEPKIRLSEHPVNQPAWINHLLNISKNPSEEISNLSLFPDMQSFTA